VITGKNVSSVCIADITVHIWIIRSFRVLKTFSASWTSKIWYNLNCWHSQMLLFHEKGLNWLSDWLERLNWVMWSCIRLVIHVMSCIIMRNQTVMMLPSYFNLLIFMNISIFLLITPFTCAYTKTAATNTNEKWTKKFHPRSLPCRSSVGRVVIVVRKWHIVIRAAIVVRASTIAWVVITFQVQIHVFFRTLIIHWNDVVFHNVVILSLDKMGCKDYEEKSQINHYIIYSHLNNDL
jgi:hypothetical protein